MPRLLVRPLSFLHHQSLTDAATDSVDEAHYRLCRRHLEGKRRSQLDHHRGIDLLRSLFQVHQYVLLLSPRSTTDGRPLAVPNEELVGLGVALASRFVPTDNFLPKNQPKLLESVLKAIKLTGTNLVSGGLV
jgi:hypothetical protein